MKRKTRCFWARVMVCMMLLTCLCSRKGVTAYAGAAVTLMTGGANVTYTLLELNWFEQYESITINYACNDSEKKGFGVGGVQKAADGYDTYFNLTANSADATIVQAFTITKADLVDVAGVSFEKLPSLQVATWNEGYILSIVGNPKADEPLTPTSTPATAAAEIGYNLELNTSYTGTVKLTGNSNEGYSKYFMVADKEIKEGDVYTVSLTLSNATKFKQFALQGTYNNWAWNSGLDEGGAFDTWQNDGIADGLKLNFRIGVTESGVNQNNLNDSFEIKLHVSNPVAALESTEEIIIVTDLVISREQKPAEPTDMPEDTRLFTNGMTIELDKSYTGTVARQAGSYYEMAGFYLKDTDAKAGDVYHVTYSLSGANYNQVGFQTDADIVTADSKFPWHNTYWSSDTAMPDGNIESFTVEVTADGAAKFDNGLVACKMTAGDLIGSSDSAITISNLKITVTRKQVDETAEYRVLTFDENVDTAFQKDPNYGTLYKLIDITQFPELTVDTVVAVFSANASFNGTIGTNIDGVWTNFDQTGASGHNTWKVTGLAGKNTDGSLNVQIWWKENTTTVTLQKVIIAEAGADFSSEINNSNISTPTPMPTLTPSPVTPAPTAIPAPTPTAVPEETGTAQTLKPGDKISLDFAAFADMVDKVEVTLTSNGYFNGCLGVSVGGGWEQTEPSSEGGTVTWSCSGIAGREASGYGELQIWYANDGVSITLDKIAYYDKAGNAVGPDGEAAGETEENPEENPEDDEKPKKMVIIREIPGEGTTEIKKLIECSKVLDANAEETKMFQIPMEQFAGNGSLKKINVTITFDQTVMQYWTGGAGAIGYSTDSEWQQIEFENAFIDGTKNTVEITIDVPEGVNPTFDDGSIFQIGWWWGSTASISVDKVEFVFEKENVTTVSIEVNENPVLLVTEPGSQNVSITDLVRDTAAVNKIELHMAATGSFHAAVYMDADLSAETSEIQLMAKERIKLGEISMDKSGYETFTFENLAEKLTGDLIVDITSVEEGATVALDSISLYSMDDELLTDEAETDGSGTEEPKAEENETNEAEEPETEEPVSEPEVEPTDDAKANEQAEGEKKPEETAELPKTGRMNAGWFYFLGMAMAGAGAVLLRKKEAEA